MRESVRKVDLFGGGGGGGGGGGRERKRLWSILKEIRMGYVVQNDEER